MQASDQPTKMGTCVSLISQNRKPKNNEQLAGDDEKNNGVDMLVDMKTFK